METAHLIDGGRPDDQIHSSHSGSAGNSQEVSIEDNPEVSTGDNPEVRTGDNPEVRTGDNPEVRTGDNPEVSNGGNLEVSIENNQAFNIPDNANGTTNPDRKEFHINRFVTRKTITHGLLNVALLTANASQLKIVLDTGTSHPYFVLLVILITLSIVLQVVAGGLLAYLSKLDIHNADHQDIAAKLNNAVGILVFLATVVNIIIPVFGPELPVKP